MDHRDHGELAVRNESRPSPDSVLQGYNVVVFWKMFSGSLAFEQCGVSLAEDQCRGHEYVATECNAIAPAFGELVNQAVGTQKAELPGDEGATPTALSLVAAVLYRFRVFIRL
jgi:hypothetical protein